MTAGECRLSSFLRDLKVVKAIKVVKDLKDFKVVWGGAAAYLRLPVISSLYHGLCCRANQVRLRP